MYRRSRGENSKPASGRSYQGTYSAKERWWRLSNYGWIIKKYTEANQRPEDQKPEEQAAEITEPKLNPLEVKKVNFKVFLNTADHHTEAYEITTPHKVNGESVPSQLVVRRGQAFDISLKFDREYVSGKDNVKLVFEIDDKPMVSKGTQVTLNLNGKVKSRHWSAEITSSDGVKVKVRVLTPPDCIVGKWALSIESRLEKEAAGATNHGARKKDILKYEHPHKIYLLFNPFCKEDDVYLESDELRDEYVLNDTGKIYTGNSKQVGFKPWNFGQFEDFMLDCAMYLLGKSGLRYPVRGSPVRVSRTISGMVNAPDDDGVLIGNWSGDYSDGTAPSHWIGSVAILEEYWKNKSPVAYGQCWVFSGVVTTICRCLGIPCRSVTNFASAHDCDGSITIDIHMDRDGERLEEFNEDSVWNFHVWNEAWMNRTDLPTGYGGWQALDSTPQELSDGVYCCGPCPLKAIKEGQVNVPYDASFIFAEVNADKVYWIRDEELEWTKKLEKCGVGKKISTKRPRKAPRPSSPRNRWRLPVEDKDREDLTDSYKYKEGSSEERTAVRRANTQSTRPDLYADPETDDVKFELDQKDEVLVGSGFDVVLKVQNKSRSKRRVYGLITLTAMYYTGVTKGKVKSQKFSVTLDAIRAEEAIMRVSAEEYLHHIVDQVSFKITVLAHVKETGQVQACYDDFRLRRPDLELKAPETVKVKTPFECVVSFANSMPVHLHNVEWMIEGPGIQRPLRKQERDLEPYDQVQWKVTLTPERSGTRQIMASLTSKELMDVTGMCELQVTEDPAQTAPTQAAAE